MTIGDDDDVGADGGERIRMSGESGVVALDGTRLPDVESLAGGDGPCRVDQADVAHPCPQSQCVGDRGSDGAGTEDGDCRHDA
jgi:hypothetical protein